MGLKMFARVIGILFLILGVLGFFMKDLLGIIHLDSMHNVIHLAVGILGLLASAQEGTSRLFARVLGVVYVLMGIVGFFVPELFGMMHVEWADNVLHLVVGAAALYLGFTAADSIKRAKFSRSA